jgi:taurine dioxygenase
MRAFVDTLTARHDGAKGYGEDYGISAETTGRAYNHTNHPIIINHPVTGQRTLFVNTGFTTRINGIAAHESRSLLDMLFRHIDLTVTAHVRVRWAQNTLVMWDNIATQHQGVWDYFPETRLAERVSVIGPKLAGI